MSKKTNILLNIIMEIGNNGDMYIVKLIRKAYPSWEN